MVVGVVALFAAWGQLPLLLTQAQDRSTVAELVTQTSVLPNPLTSTLTLNGVLPHEKSATLKPAEALPGRANRAAANAAPPNHAALEKLDIESSQFDRLGGCLPGGDLGGCQAVQIPDGWGSTISKIFIRILGISAT
jgi:hypothetical protein